MDSVAHLVGDFFERVPPFGAPVLGDTGKPAVGQFA
jgi:hypothetical protein